MSGTGQFRSGGIGSRVGLTAATAREHLGDRLAAFVDGELGDDARERVLSHLATCDGCKTEADEQRRLKDAVAGALPPALSAGLLARLQGLPGCPPGGPGASGGEGGRGGFGGLGDIFGSRGDRRSFLAAVTPADQPQAGFPIHELARPASRSRRLAFAAAGAFSLAALALGVAVPADSGLDGGGLPDPANGTAATPLSISVDGRGPSAPTGSPVPVDAARPMLSPNGGSRQPAATGPDAPRPADTPGPSPSASPGPARVTAGQALTARSVAPAPMPLLGDEDLARISGVLSGPRPQSLAR